MSRKELNKIKKSMQKSFEKADELKKKSEILKEIESIEAEKDLENKLFDI